MTALAWFLALALLTAACSSTRPPTPAPAFLTLSWTDNTAGAAVTLIERRASAEPAFAQVAAVLPGVTRYVDAAVVAGERYCYRARTIVGEAVSDYSTEACQ